MRGDRRGHQVHALVPERDALRGLAVIRNARVGLGVTQLLCACVGGVDAGEAAGEPARRLAVARSAVPGQAMAGGDRSQVVEERVRVTGPGPGVPRCEEGVMVLEGHG